MIQTFNVINMVISICFVGFGAWLTLRGVALFTNYRGFANRLQRGQRYIKANHFMSFFSRSPQWTGGLLIAVGVAVCAMAIAEDLGASIR